MNIENVFITLYVLWHFNNYGTPKYLYLLCQKFYFLLQKYHQFWNPDYFVIEDKKKTEAIVQNPTPKPVVKYEDKYLEEIRKMSKEYNFTDEEQKIKIQKFEQIIDTKVKEKREKMTEYEIKIKNINLKIKDYKILMM